MNDSSKANESISAMQLVTSSVVPRALKTAIELNLLELMKKATGFVSASELAALIQTTNPEAHLMIDRILRLLAANNILECTLKNDGGSDVERFYSLAPVGKLFTNNDNGVSLAPFLLLNEDKVTAETFHHLKDAIVEGGVPFYRAHGMSAFEYPAADPGYDKVFNNAMYGQSTMIMYEILEKYNGFEGVESVVDVGGGIGASLMIILSKYPSIKAINFDLPGVIQQAASHPGMEHIGGDMFVSVPKGDVIFIKSTLHDWGDAQCLKILKNCYEALPVNGKVVVADHIVPEIPNKNDPFASIDLAADLLMLTCTGGKERTEAEFQALAKATGFKRFRRVCCALSIWIMELYK